MNVFLMRGEEIRRGIDIYPVLSEQEKADHEKSGKELESIGKSKKAATLAVGETALSRVFNATPIMVLPPLILVRLQRTEWLRRRPRVTLPVNLGKRHAWDREIARMEELKFSRVDIDNEYLCAAACTRSVSPETIYRCEETGGALLGSWRRGR